MADEARGSGADGEGWEDFGQRVDLTARIREILLNYPEGTSILKEVVQNADDAKASCIKFVLDCRQHGTGSLLGPRMAAFQGPALLAFNDGVFSERDLESISRIGDSKKKEEEGKTGRFGVGFNSCYHLTDLPSFVSGRHLVIFDPHCRHLPNVSSTNPGKRIDFVKHSDVASQYADQVAPFAGVFGCTLGAGGADGGPWHGTLFRFPLRSAELAEASTISKQVYTPESVRALLEQLCNEAFQILLFLKHIARVEVHEWPSDATGPRLLFSCHVANATAEISAQRGLFARLSAQRPSAKTGPGPGAGSAAALPEVLQSYRLELQREWRGPGAGAAEGGGAGEGPRAPEHRAYVVAQMRGGGEVAELAEQLSRHFGVPLVPWGAVAADVTAPPRSGADGGGGGVAAAEEGRAFCFLPLPARTGLPVHVNGYFELSSNRRDIWYGEDMAGSGARRAQWNMLLLERVLAPAYAAALAEAAKVLGHGPAYDRLWPAADVSAPWQTLLVALYRRLAELPVCWSPVRGGCWVPPRAGVLPDAAAAAHPELTAALVEVAGLPLLELPRGVPELMGRHMVTKPRVCSPALARQALLAAAAGSSASTTAGAPPAGAEPSADASLRAHASPLLDYVLSDLQLTPPAGQSASAAATAVTAMVSHAAAQLAGLRLLPLLDQTTAVIRAASGKAPTPPQLQQRGAPPLFFLPTEAERALLSRAGGLLVDAGGLGPAGQAKLRGLAAHRVLNVAQLDAPAMAALVLPRLLPPAWLAPPGGAVVQWQDDAMAAEAGVDRAWLALLWQWLATHGPLSSFLGMPLLPILGGRLAPLADYSASTAILPPPASFLLTVRPSAAYETTLPGGGGALPPPEAAEAEPAAQLSDVLTQLGLQIVDTAHFPDLPVPELLRGGHLHACDGPGVLAALQRLSLAIAQRQGRASVGGSGLTEGGGGGGSAAGGLPLGFAARISALPPSDKRLLRSLLLTEDCLGVLSGAPQRAGGSAACAPARLPPSEARSLLQLLAALPIFEAAAAPVAAASSGAGVGGAAAPEPRFVPLLAAGGGGGVMLAPPGVDARILGSLSGVFVLAGSEAEGRLLVAHLGVRPVSAAEAYRRVATAASHVLPVLSSLPPELRDAAVLGVLRGLPQLGAQDRSFAAWLAQVPFVPNNKGELHVPGELYDPRIPELAALLDPETDFPATSLLLEAAGAADAASASAGAATTTSNPQPPQQLRPEQEGGGVPRVSSASGVGGAGGGGGGGATAADASLVLYMLQQLGLRTAASMDTLLRAARFVERLADAAAEATAEASAAAVSTASTPTARLAAAVSVDSVVPDLAAAAAAAAEDTDMAVARGKALLAYLDVEAGRIMGPVGAAASATPGSVQAGAAAGAAASQVPQSGGGGGGGAGAGAARKFAAGLLNRAKELFTQGGQEQPAVAEVHSFWVELSRLRWCPVLPEPPSPGLPWPPRHAVPRLAAPRTVRPASDMWLSSGCMFLVDGECRSSALAAGLGWSAPLPGSVLAQQLLQLGELHSSVSDPSLSQVLAGVVPLLYRSLAGLGLHESAVARGLLHGSRCVWVGNGFAPAGRVAFKGSLDLSPWLYVMPAELAPFKDLLLSYGAADGFSAVQYCSVLQDLAAATGVIAPPPGSAAAAAAAAAAGGEAATPTVPQALTEAQLGQAVAVAQALADLALPPGATIYLPDERGVLAPAGELAFNDAPWLAGQPAAASVRLVHPRISAHVAARLGTPSLRRLLLAASADSMALGTVGGAEAFGQSEALTTRLRHIIGDYPEGPGVLMELLQNADDAGATSLELMLDTTSYPTASILAPAMAVWQGPALLVANDAVFSPADFANISRIGQDSKASRPTSIGRFGLGFNAVYHFTDLPCFVSGDYLVMFDPHAKYLPGVSAAQPGLKIAFARAQLLQQFPDAFTPFTHLGCTMRERFNGTLFRFPLRGAAAAAASDIKSSSCGPEDVEALLEAFRRQLPSALLFLKNIRTVTAYVRAHPGAAGAEAAAGNEGVGEGAHVASVRMLFRATRAPDGGQGAGSESDALQSGQGGLLQSSITRFIAGPPSDPIDLPTFYKRLSATQPGALPSQMGLIRLTLEVMGQQASSPPPAAGAAEGSGGTVLAAGAGVGVAATSERWLVCNALGGGAAREMAVRSFRSSGVKTVPWVGVAARVPADLDAAAQGPDGESHAVSAAAKHAEKGGDGVDGRAFCFLPLPIRTCLPVHVNGYFELSSNRRDIWYGGDMSGAGATRSSWNVALLTDALAPCYGRVLVAAAQHLGPCETLYRLLPSLDTPEPWSHLVQPLYADHLGDLPVVWTRAGGGRWITPKTALFADAACAADLVLRQLLVSLGLPLACDMPPAAEASLLRGVPGAAPVSPQRVRAHLAAALRAAGGDATVLSQQIAAAASAARVEAADALSGAKGSKAEESQRAPGEPKEGALSVATAVAVLLRYCLSDLEAAADPKMAKPGQQQQQQPWSPQAQAQRAQQLQQLQQDLDGLPLLPLADGTVGRLQAVPSAAVGGKSPRGPRGPAVHVYVLTGGPLEEQLLSGLRGRYVAPDLAAAFVESLQKVVDLGLFNLQRLSPGLLDSMLLPLLLPPSWYGVAEVEWAASPGGNAGDAAAAPAHAPSAPPPAGGVAQAPATTPTAQQQQQQQLPVAGGGGGSSAPSVEWIRTLWSWLAERPDAVQLGSWPVLPIQGNRLGRLQEKSLPSLAGLLAAIAAAKARALDAGAASAGAAEAGDDRRRHSASFARGTAGAVAGGDGRGDAAWASRLAELTAVERRQLRSYLLQSRWFSGATPQLSGAELDLLRSLPVYEVHSDPDSRADDPAARSNQAANGGPAAPPDVPAAAAAAGGGAPSSAPQQPPQRQHQLGQLSRFTALDPRRQRLAPPDTDPRVLSSTFVATDSLAEEVLIESRLGVVRLSAAELLAQHVAPAAAAGRLAREALAAHMAALLGRLAGVEGAARPGAEESRALRQALSEHPLIPTAAAAAELRRPAELHDPRVPALTALLPAASAFFPAPSLAPPTTVQGSRLLDALGQLGMARTVDLRVIVTAARAVSEEHAAWAAGQAAAAAAPPPAPPSAAGVAPAARAAASVPAVEAMLSRARALLKELEAWAAQRGGAGAAARRDEEEQRMWLQLAGLSWCPVLQVAPETGLPWPSLTQPALLAPPRVVRPPGDAWLVSAALQLLERPVGQHLAAALGWDAPPRVSVLAAQLLELGRMHALKPRRLMREPEAMTAPPPQPAGQGSAAVATRTDGGAPEPSPEAKPAPPAAGSTDAGAPEAEPDAQEQRPVAATPATPAAAAEADAAAAAAQLGKALDRAVHRLYDALSRAVDGPEGDMVLMSFERPDTPCVWVGPGGGFVTPGSAVLHSEGDFRPYLWVVPEPFHAYDRLLALMGVQERLTAQHFATGLAALASAAGGLPLDDTSLALALQLADCAADALAAHGRPAGQSVFYVPDASGVMAPAPQLFFNDAEWLEARDVSLAHGGLPAATAEALGVRSLRYAHEVEAQQTSALPCPSPAELRERLGLSATASDAATPAEADLAGVSAVATFLFELLELADALGLRAVRLVLDARQHPDQSLLQPALAAFQGPALCAVLPEVALSAEDLAYLLCSRAQPHVVRGRATPYSAGLQSAFLVSEILQVVSGSSTYMFDPSGVYLGGGGGGGEGRGASARSRVAGGTPRAKQYVHVNSDLLSTFADQFAVWSFAEGYDIHGHVPGTLLRLPLRREAPRAAAAGGAGAGAGAGAAAGRSGRSGGSGASLGLRGGGLAAASCESVERALRVFAAQGPRSLLFLQSLTGIEVSMLPAGAPARSPAPQQHPGAGAGSGPGPALGRELLLQASLVPLDPDRPRPVYSSAAKQRSAGFGKVLASLGRSLVRSGGNDNHKQYMCPLELHVLVHNALLLPTAEPTGMPPVPPAPHSGAGAGASTAAAASAVPEAGAAAVSAAGGSLQLSLFGGNGDRGGAGDFALLGNTLYRERWLLSSSHDLDGVPLPPAAAAGGATQRPELVAAAAVCIGRNEERDLFPVGGLHAPVYLPTARELLGDAAAAAAASAGPALGRMPFLIAGHLYLSRRGGKHILSPFSRAEAAAAGLPTGAGAGMPAVQPPGADAAAPASPRSSSSSVAALPLPPVLQHRCEHNRRVLDLAAACWQSLASFLCSPDMYNGPRGRLYNLFPDIAAAAAAAGGPDGRGGDGADDAAVYCLRQMYAGASRLPLWRLRTGRFVHLPEGCFLQATTQGLGTAAMGFMARQLPLFDVPWVTKEHLEAAGVHGLRVVSPAVVRPMLKGLARPQGAAPGAAGALARGRVAWPNLTVLEATELLQFCSADLLAEQGGPGSGGGAASAGAAAAAARAAQHGPGQAQAAAVAPSGGVGAPAPGMGTLIDELRSQVRNVVGELVGPALYDQLRQQALGLLPAAAPGPAQPAQQPAQAAAAVLPRYNMNKVQDCKGLPVPTAAGKYLPAEQVLLQMPLSAGVGTVETLGASLLLAAPPLATVASPASLLPPQFAGEIVHPDCVAKLAEHFKDPQYRSSLALRLYSLADLANHLRTALPAGWDHPLAPGTQQYDVAAGAAAGRGGPTGLGPAWDGGAGTLSDSPSGLWLLQLWQLINGVLEAAVEWQASRGVSGSEVKLEALQHWPLVPALGPAANAGVLLPVRHRGLFFCLPLRQQQAPAAAAAAAKAGVKEAGGEVAGQAGGPSPDDDAQAAAAGPVPALQDLVPRLAAPWDWLAPALHAIGCPLLDPRFASAAGRHCDPQPHSLPPRSLEEAASATNLPAGVSGGTPPPSRGSSRSSGSAAAVGSSVAALVSKLRQCDAACGGALPQRVAAAWDGTTRAAVLGLLAEGAPSTLEAPDILFLRRLPIYPTHSGEFTALEAPEAGSAAHPTSAGAAAGVAQGAGGATARAAAATAGAAAGAAALSTAPQSQGAVEMAPVVCPPDLLEMVPGLLSALPPSLPRRLLLPQPAAFRLLTLLGVTVLTAPAFLAAVALPTLGALPDGVRALLLTHIQSQWPRLRSDESLLAALRDTPFVLTADGSSRRPPELYDPEVPLFKAAFLGRPVFPADQFAYPQWRQLLQDAGMQTSLSAASLLAAAEAVAGRGADLHLVLPGEGLPAETDSMEDPFLATGASEVPAPVEGARGKLLAAADQLVAALLSQGTALAGAGGVGREWWASLSKLSFVPARLGPPGSRKARQVLTSFSSAAVAADWPLVWSVLPVVAAERVPPAGLGQGQLRIRSPPPLQAVVAHLKRVGADHGEEALGSWPAAAGEVEEAFRAVLAYLDREGVAGAKAAQLQDVAFVPVARGTLLAPPRRLYLRLKEDLAPLAFELPPSLAPFTPLLKALGVRDEPRAQDLLDMLRGLAASAGSAPLGPNQRAAVLRLLMALAGQGSSAQGPAGGAGQGGSGLGGSAADLAALEAARKERKLLVLSSEGRLVPAHTAVSVADGGGGWGAGRLLGRLDPAALTLAHPALPVSVASRLGCPRLTDLAEERLEPGHALEPVDAIQGLALRDARSLLASPAFVAACHALLRAHGPLLRAGGEGPAAAAAAVAAGGGGGGSGATRGSVHELAATLRNAARRLTFVRSLRTVAVLRASGAALSPEGEAARVAYDFVESAPAPAAAGPSSSAAAAVGALDAGRIFIAEPPPYLPVSWLLSGVVSRVLGSPISLPLQPLFTTPPSELAGLQPLLLPGGFDAKLEAAARAGSPGAPLLPADAALLALRPLRRYCAGERVAVRREDAGAAAGGGEEVGGAAGRRLADPAGVASPVHQALDVGGAGAGGGGGGGGGMVYGNMVYGIVAAHCAPSGSGGLHRVLVEVEPGVVRPLLSSQVFCFRSSLGEDAGSDAGAGPGSTLLGPAAGHAAAGPASAVPLSSPPAASQGGGAAAGLSAAAAASAPVRGAELVSAVRDVLSAAGLPLDPAAGALMAKVAALQDELAATRGQLEEAKHSASAAATDAEATRGSWQCKICFSRDVDCAYTGCGHLICATCGQASGTNRCPVCRKPSQALLRLYRA
ncbi:hypothetical protein GPECTOR_3g279 [Gonium pectorale]|uniref:RING-type domain-containing protein n=1 Tax=Gonium pectorale TaxID=33097 RepID=A0A150GYY7_GONPE|nr:hypothetical protein GPECTOR_3g279 [Gonium pectorale]|eukprot:KXZ55127.1 hypothetical protein GPECTOR_3g279 [Gonium pectorale]